MPGRAWSSSPPPGGPAGRYLTNPGAYTARLARLLLAIGEHQGPTAGPLLAAAVAAAVAGRAWLRRRQHPAFPADARTVTILSPPQADPDGAAALWGHLTGLLRPPRARLLAGQPHLGWEYTWHDGRAVDPAVGTRDHPARHDRARRRGGLARHAHRHLGRQPPAATRRADGRWDAAAGPPGDPADQHRSRP